MTVAQCSTAGSGTKSLTCWSELPGDPVEKAVTAEWTSMPLLPANDHPGFTLCVGLISLARCVRYQLLVTLLKLLLKALCIRE